jgi:hypothetical protein
MRPVRRNCSPALSLSQTMRSTVSESNVFPDRGGIADEGARLFDRIAALSREIAAIKARLSDSAERQDDRARACWLVNEIRACVSRARERDLVRQERNASSRTGLAILDAVMELPPDRSASRSRAFSRQRRPADGKQNA